ncbi:acetamidase/formamidase family protein [Geminicoccaceae bacterium 1502E]|nr:acetamidase/formamidase family protein [Geminicoccaceae bacterium 1502E]
MSRHHEIPPVPEAMAWGHFDAAHKPVLEIDSGDTVHLTSWPAGTADRLPADGSLVDPRHREALERCERFGGTHFVTGPVAVRGAAPGDVLQIDILGHEFPGEWGYVAHMPLAGTLPEEFDEKVLVHARIDRERNVCSLPWGKELPLDPFFGIIAVAPPPHWGRCPSPPPRVFGGNMDNKELKPGATLYLPVFNEGALFYAGDGHGVQGDGEVCVTALETGLSGSFRLTVRKDLGFERPFAENATHLISIGLHEDLDRAAEQAVREMIDHVCRRTKLSRSEAYMLCSLIGDLRVTQTVDGVKGCHMMLAKEHL